MQALQTPRPESWDTPVKMTTMMNWGERECAQVFKEGEEEEDREINKRKKGNKLKGRGKKNRSQGELGNIDCNLDTIGRKKADRVRIIGTLLHIYHVKVLRTVTMVYQAELSPMRPGQPSCASNKSINLCGNKLICH